MADSAMTVVAIFLAAILMFIFPLMTMADKNDDVTTLDVQIATSEFTDTIRATGKLTQDEYDNFVLTLASTGNSYDVEITVQVLDQNPAKKEYSTKATIGNNVYYTVYTSQILEKLKEGSYVLKEGDIVSVYVKNTNITIAEELRNFVYMITGNSSSTITASDSGIVSATGK